ncbi:MAG: cytochrome c3 family protein [Firmicutes bacterium]|nr:cytochrome c3 family protein [Bacillota bacterium]
MKKLFVLFVAMALVAAFAVPCLATIVGTKHDFTVGTDSTAIKAVTNQGDEICKACHVPHNAIATSGTYDVSGILWAKDYGAANITGQTLKVRNSILCMGCHDGVIADAANTDPAAPKFDFTTRTTALGTDLTNDHPVDVVYTWYDTTKSYAQTAFKDPATFAGKIRLYTGTDASTNNVACQSCHDVHGKADSTGANIPKFLRINNSASALCLTCHNK